MAKINIQPDFNNQNFEKYQDFDKVMDKYNQNPTPENGGENKNGKKFNFKIFIGPGIAAITIIASIFYMQKDKKSHNEKTNETQQEELIVDEEIVFSPNIPVDTLKLNINPDSSYIITQNDYFMFIPPKTLVDENNEYVEGEVEFLFQGYKNVAEIASSNIPMNYDSNGTTYAFQSGGMFQLRAYQRNNPINIKPKKEITIAYKTELEQSGNVYYYDEQKNNWTFTEKDKGLQNTDSIAKIIDELITESLIDNINDKRVVFDLDVLTSDFPQLKPLKGILFSVADKDSLLVRTIAQTQWNFVEATINKNNVKFCFGKTNTDTNACLLTRPVVTSKKEIKSLKNKLQDFVQTKQQSIIDQKKQLVFESNKNQIYRAFKITGFGVWNCDRPFKDDDAIVQLDLKLPNGESLDEHKTFQLIRLNNKAIATGRSKKLKCKKGQKYIIMVNDYDAKKIYSTKVFTVKNQKPLALKLKETDTKQMVLKLNTKL
ncbi:MAG TPA: hypothetical protein DIU39_07790 [Flavobacteriales bacterium]|nr:hypothetical protein [Flavobacteriales bacterium]|tara:strand:- start:40694 stop:42154 length:1461 start_codon:yes stop_codon:yes gene_type:complete